MNRLIKELYPSGALRYLRDNTSLSFYEKVYKKGEIYPLDICRYASSDKYVYFLDENECWFVSREIVEIIGGEND